MRYLMDRDLSSVMYCPHFSNSNTRSLSFLYYGIDIDTFWTTGDESRCYGVVCQLSGNVIGYEDS